MKINIELTPIQKEKVRTLIEHTKRDISAGQYGTYRKLHTKQLDEKAIRQSEASIKLLEELSF